MHQNKNKIHINNRGNIKTQTMKHNLQEIAGRNIGEKVFVEYKKQDTANRIEQQQDAKPL